MTSAYKPRLLQIPLSMNFRSETLTPMQMVRGRAVDDETHSMIGDQMAGHAKTAAGRSSFSVLLVRDATSALSLVPCLRDRAGTFVDVVNDLNAALAAAQARRPALAVVEMRLQGGSGLALMDALHRILPDLPVIIVSEQPSIPEAVHVMQTGAESYVAGGASPDLLRAVRAVLERPSPYAAVGRRLIPPGGLPSLVGESEAMQAVLRQVSLVAPARTNVLPLGESTSSNDGPSVPGATFREIERHAIMTTYEACGRSPQRTAEILGISPRTVHYRLREYRGERGRRLSSFPNAAATTISAESAAVTPEARPMATRFQAQTKA